MGGFKAISELADKFDIEETVLAEEVQIRP
jgi:hypothetical protein